MRNAAHVALWAGMCPSHEESGGQRRSGRIWKGKRSVRAAFVQAAHATRKTQTSLGEHYRRLSKRRGPQRVAVAVGQSILVIFSHRMETDDSSQETGEAFFQERNKQRMQRHVGQRVGHLGYQVSVQPLLLLQSKIQLNKKLPTISARRLFGPSARRFRKMCRGEKQAL